MSRLALLFALVATPAMAHHEAAMIASSLPVIAGFAFFVTTGIARVWVRFRTKARKAKST